MWTLAPGRANKGAESAISHNWAWLADKGLVSTGRGRGVLRVVLRDELLTGELSGGMTSSNRGLVPIWYLSPGRSQ